MPLLTSTVVDLSSLGAINWSAPSWDMVIALFFIVGTVIFGLSLGRQRTVITIVSVYMALAVEPFAPLVAGWLGTGFTESPAIKTIGFLGAFVLCTFLLSHSGLVRNLVNGRDREGAWYQTMLLSAVLMGFLISAVLKFIPPEVTAGLHDTTERLLATTDAQFAWHIVPLVAMILTGKRPRRRRQRVEDFD